MSDLTIIRREPDAATDAERIAGLDVARLIAFAEAWGSGWKYTFDENGADHASDQLRGLGELISTAASSEEPLGHDGLFFIADAVRWLAAIIAASMARPEGLVRLYGAELATEADVLGAPRTAEKAS
jgi:hypothetical protein